MDRGDYARASEKLWDAVTQSVKVATREWAAEGPREMRRLVDRLFRATDDRDLLRLYGVAESLRANAAEDFMSADAVRAYAEDVRALIDKLHAIANFDEAQAPPPASPEAVLAVRQHDFEQHIQGLSRRETRKEVLAELASIDGQLDGLKPPGRKQAAIPGSPEARIANALRQMESCPEDPTGQELGLYRQWLLGVLTGGGQRA